MFGLMPQKKITQNWYLNVLSSLPLFWSNRLKMEYFIYIKIPFNVNEISQNYRLLIEAPRK